MNDAYGMALGKILTKRPPIDDDQDDFELDMEDGDDDMDMNYLAAAPSNSGKPPVNIPDWMKRGGLYPGT